MFHIKQNDLNPVYETVLKRGTATVDLTTATSVTFKMRKRHSTILVVDAAATIDTPATDGTVYYTWVTGDTATAGSYDAEWEVLWPSGTETFPTLGYDRVAVDADL